MNNSKKIKRMVGIASLAAIVAVLQLLSTVIKLGPFSITLALIPLVIGAVLYGPKGGAFLGFIMGFIVLVTDAQAFYIVNPFVTIVLCLLKSTVAGIVAGVVYKVLKSKSNKVAIVAASILTPITNTGIFAIGCILFFIPTLKEWANGSSAFAYLFFTLIGWNFILEFTINSILAPTVTYIVNIVRNNFNITE